MARVPTATLLLRPGVPVVRRDAETLQVGLDPPHVALLPDTPDVRALIALLRSGSEPESLPEGSGRALHTLRAAGLVHAGVPPVTDAELLAHAQFGADGVRRLAARTRHAIGVRSEDVLRPVALELAALAGLAVDDDQPAVWLVVATGEVPRDSVDPLVRAGAPHLLVSGTAVGRRVGPFVDPGRTACLRCVDAHESLTDPRRPFLVEQAARAAAGGQPPPTDPVLDRLALAFALRDLSRYVEGDEPSTWSATVDVGPTGEPRVARWLRHPHCGCAWDLLRELP